MTMHELLDTVAGENASDLHITVGLPPIMRKNGRLIPIGDKKILPDLSETFAREIMSEKQWHAFKDTGEYDFSFSFPGKFRYRVNVFRQRGCISIALRIILSNPPPIEQLGLPPAIKDLCELNRGLILVTGITGSGKSTTLASMIDRINHMKDKHILTLEDPIEYLHKHHKCIVNQREIGTDSESYSQALRAALRQDPDIILVGEMRDLETISIALTAAETGHLVLSTLHTIGAAKTIDRIIDAFPPYQQQQIRIQISTTLMAVISQQLIPAADGSGRTAAVEVMLANAAIRNLIRENKTPQILSVIQTSMHSGMKLMDNAIADLYRKGNITQEAAVTHCVDPAYIKKLLF